MKTKLYLTIGFAIVILLSACSQETTHTGETHMGKYVNVTLEEDLTSPDVTATVEMIDPIEGATLWIDDSEIGTFVEGKLYYTPFQFGDVACEIKSGDEVYYDTLKLYIETGYIRYNSSGENGDLKDPVEGGEVVLTPSNVTLGSNDKIWAYDLRVPKDGKITFNYESILLSGSKKVELHFRLDDYADRYDLYPDEQYPQQYIDAETDKWISAPMELTHGIYTVYVCPNFISDKSYVSVIHSSDFSSGTFSANYQSITSWPE